MAGEMLRLTYGSTDYILSAVNRSYGRSYQFVGSSARAVTGRLNVRSRALKTVHNVEWAALPYDLAPDGGLGLSGLQELYLADVAYTLTVLLYAPSGEETFTVRFDPERGLQFNLLPWVGANRRFWRVSIALVEV